MNYEEVEKLLKRELNTDSLVDLCDEEICHYQSDLTELS